MAKKRGRPKEEGTPGRELYKAAEVVYAYNNRKSAGVKHVDALKETAEEVKAKIPGIRISATEVRRIRAAFQPKGSESFIVTAPDAKASAEIRILPDGTPVTKGLEFGFGKRPQHPRSNAKNSASEQPSQTLSAKK